mmetsp:Transcript_5010/g.9672  ORF Transcript_5010/g.9672 Transcript_5010/m.9672 type:complete len:957 (+) Transcript_5010:27-2897(+)
MGKKLLRRGIRFDLSGSRKVLRNLPWYRNPRNFILVVIAVITALAFGLAMFGTPHYGNAKHEGLQTFRQLPQHRSATSTSASSKVKFAIATTILRPGKELFDAVAVVATAARNSHGTDSKYPADLIAFVHKDYMHKIHITLLESSGWKVLPVECPVHLEDIRNVEFREEIAKSGCCGADELIKILAYKQTEYTHVLHLDLDTIMIDNVNELIELDQDLVFTKDLNLLTENLRKSEKRRWYAMIQGGFILLRPDIRVYQDLVELIKEGDWGGQGWGRSDIGYGYGGQTVQGVLPYYWQVVRNSTKLHEADNCVYNVMSEGTDPSWEVMCDTSNPHRVKFGHFTICQKPWTCSSPQGPACRFMVDSWWEMSRAAEKELALPARNRCKRGEPYQGFHRGVEVAAMLAEAERAADEAAKSKEKKGEKEKKEKSRKFKLEQVMQQAEGAGKKRGTKQGDDQSGKGGKGEESQSKELSAQQLVDKKVKEFFREPIAACPTPKAPSKVFPAKSGFPELAIVITIMKMDGDSTVLMDALAVLAKSVQLAMKGSKYGYHMVAMLQRGKVSAGKQKQLKETGWHHLIEKDVPVALDEITDKFYREEVEHSGCCGYAELIKFCAYTLTNYSFVLHLDVDTLLLAPVDQLLELDKQLLFTKDINMLGPQKSELGARARAMIQGGFILLRPNITVFHDLLAVVRKGDFRSGVGWGGSGIGWGYGGPTVQGILPYYWQILRKATPDTYCELSECEWDRMQDEPHCNQDPKTIKLMHFTVCQKPWFCTGTATGPGCAYAVEKWWEISRQVEDDLGIEERIRCKGGKYEALRRGTVGKKLPYYTLNKGPLRCVSPVLTMYVAQNNAELKLVEAGQNGHECPQFQLTADGSIAHRNSGKCVHPYGGGQNPAKGTHLVMFSQCDMDRIAFEVKGKSLVHKKSGLCVLHEKNSNKVVVGDCASEDVLEWTLHDIV